MPRELTPIDITFPVKGLDETSPFESQAEATSPDLLNVRAFDVRTGRMRGGQRPGLEKYLSDPIVSDKPIQCMAQISATEVQASPQSSINNAIVCTDSSATGYAMIDSGGIETGDGVGGVFVASRWDSIGNYFVLTYSESAGLYQIAKYQYDRVQIWQAYSALFSGTSVDVAKRSALAIDASGLWILLAQGPGTGVAADAVYQLYYVPNSNPPNGILSSSVYGVVVSTSDPLAGIFDVLSISGVHRIVSSGGNNCVVANVVTNGANDELRLQRINVSGAIEETVVVTSVATATPSNMLLFDIAEDSTTRFCLSHMDSTGLQMALTMYSYDSSGNLVKDWTTIGANTAATSPAPIKRFAVAMAPAGVAAVKKLAVVGKDLFGTTKNLSFVNPTTGQSTQTAAVGTVNTSGNVLSIRAKSGFLQSGWYISSDDGIVSLDSIGSVISSFGNLGVVTGYVSPFDVAIISASTAEGLVQRISRGIVVADGSVFTFGDNGAESVANGSLVLSRSASQIFAAPNGTDLFFADGANYKYYDSSENSVVDWDVTVGQLPQDSNGNRCRLIEYWRNRTVMAGLQDDPQGWFMSKVDDPMSWDYFVSPPTAYDAVSGRTSPAGLNPDKVTAIIPYNEDIILFGGDHTVYQLSGDPTAGGRFDAVSMVTGIAFGRAWCLDPYGGIYFFGSRGGVYRMVLQRAPERITANKIEQELQDIDLDSVFINMEWDDVWQGVHVFITPKIPAVLRHYFYDLRADAWFRDEFANNGHNPIVTTIVDSELFEDRNLLLGCRDGYVRKFSNTAVSDDGTAIESYVVVGPIQSPTRRNAMMIDSIEASLSNDSHGVEYSLFRGTHHEDALLSSPVVRGSWHRGLNPLCRPRASGREFYIKIGNDQLHNTWSFDRISSLVTELPGTFSRVV